MTAEKFTVSFPAELHAAARAAAGTAGMSLSSWLAEAAEEKLRTRERIADGLAAVAEFEEENGAITPTDEDQAWVDAVLSSAGVCHRLAG